MEAEAFRKAGAGPFLRGKRNVRPCDAAAVLALNLRRPAALTRQYGVITKPA